VGVSILYVIENGWNDGCDVLCSWCSRRERIGEASLVAQKAPNLGHVKLSAAGQSEGVNYSGGANGQGALTLAPRQVPQAKAFN